MELVLALEKARRGVQASPGQGAFSFDEEAHAREPKGEHDGKYKPGEFVPGKKGGPSTGSSPQEEWKQHGTRSATFKAWFGDWENDPAAASKITNEETGEPQETHPIRVYHGTDREFTQFDPTRLGSGTKHPTARLGFFFSESEVVARTFSGEKLSHGAAKDLNALAREHYGKRYDMIHDPEIRRKLVQMEKEQPIAVRSEGEKPENARVLTAYLNIRKPYQMSTEEWSRRFMVPFLTEEDGPKRVRHEVERFRAKLEAQGYDGIILGKAPGMEERPTNEYSARAFIAFRPEQIKSTDNEGTFDMNDPDIRKSMAPPLLLKARRKVATAGQGAFDFDAEAHPRAQSGAHGGKYKGGEFVPKEKAGGAAPKVSSAVVARFHNAEDGVTAHVAKVPKGFSVALQDSDSGEFVPAVMIYPTQEKAEAEARKAVGLPEAEQKKAEEPAKAYRSPYRRGSLEHAIDRAKHRQADHSVYIYPTREGYRWADTVPPGISQYVVVHPGGQVETIEPDFGEAPSMEQLRQLGEDTGEGHEEPEEAPETPAWQMHPSTYQERQGVHEPWIAEISPMQLGMMSDRQRAAYQKKRAGEWAASGQAKTEWRRKIMEAHDAGTITRDSPDLHPEAKRALLDGLAERQKSQRKATFEEAVKANGIGSMEQISVGDRLFDTYSSSYGTVTKKNRSSVKFRPDRPLYRGAPEEIKVGPGSLYRKSYDDLQREHGLAKSLLLPITLPSPTLPQLLSLNPAKGVTHAG